MSPSGPKLTLVVVKRNVRFRSLNGPILDNFRMSGSDPSRT